MNMNNPFDGTFFKFLIGFVLILFVSFGIIYLASQYKSNAPVQAVLSKTK